MPKKNLIPKYFDLLILEKPLKSFFDDHGTLKPNPKIILKKHVTCVATKKKIAVQHKGMEAH